MDGFFAAAWEHLEKGKKAALSVPFCQPLSSKTATASLCLWALASQKAVIPSKLPVWYLGKILRWESNSWVSNRHCYTCRDSPTQPGSETTPALPRSSGPRTGCAAAAGGTDCAASGQRGWAQSQVRPDCRPPIPADLGSSSAQQAQCQLHTARASFHHGCGTWQSLSNSSYAPPQCCVVLKVLDLTLVGTCL